MLEQASHLVTLMILESWCKGVKAVFGGGWNALARCCAAGPVIVVSG